MKSTLCLPSDARCYDDAAADCRGIEVPFVSTRDCCLGNGSWFSSETGGCFQCIGKVIKIDYSVHACVCD